MVGTFRKHTTICAKSVAPDERDAPDMSTDETYIFSSEAKQRQNQCKRTANRVITMMTRGWVHLCHTSIDDDQIIHARVGGPKTHDVKIRRQPSNNGTVIYNGNIITKRYGLLTVQDFSNSRAHTYPTYLRHMSSCHTSKGAETNQFFLGVYTRL